MLTLAKSTVKRPVRDDDGKAVRVGDRLQSSYGIPPVRIEGEVIKRGGRLIVLTPGHNPAECTLREFADCLGNFWITNR